MGSEMCIRDREYRALINSADNTRFMRVFRLSEIIILQFLQYTQQSCQLGFEGSYLIIMTKETAISFETRGFWKILWNEVMDMECRKYDLLTLGEVLLRLSPPANERMILGVWQEMKFTDSFRKKCLLLPDAFTPAELHWHWMKK